MQETECVVYGRVSWVFLVKPRTKDPRGNDIPLEKQKLSVQLLIPKTDVQAKQRMDAAIKAAVKQGVGRNLFKEQEAQFFDPVIHDGEKFIAKGKGKEYKDVWVINPKQSYIDNRTGQPTEIKAFDHAGNRIMDLNKIYSGCWCRLHIQFYPFSNVNTGIGTSLQGILFDKDDERLDGRTDSRDAFGDYFAPTEDDDDEDNPWLHGDNEIASAKPADDLL